MPESKVKAWVNQATLKDGLTATHFSAWAGNTNSFDILQKYGADMNIVSTNGMGLMHIAAQANQTAFIVTLSQ